MSGWQVAGRRGAAVAVLGLLVAALGGCGLFGTDTPQRPSTVAEFDDHPCALLTGEEMTGVIGEVFSRLANAAPELKEDPDEDTKNEPSCAYHFGLPKGASSMTKELQEVTVSVSRVKVGGGLGACMQAATADSSIYRPIPALGDEACLTPTYDLWVRVGTNFYHVASYPQPGWPNTADGDQSMAPLTLAVGRAVADRLPKK